MLLVVDIGTTQLRFGFAHDDAPRLVVAVPTAVASILWKKLPTGQTHQPSTPPANQPSNGDSNHAVDSAAQWSELFRAAFWDVLASASIPHLHANDFQKEMASMGRAPGRSHEFDAGRSPQDRTVFAIDGVGLTPVARLTRRLQVAESIFSSASSGQASAGLVFAEQALLACLGSGRRCALVVHSGAHCTYVVPVVRRPDDEITNHDELTPIPLLRASHKSSLAGMAVTDFLGAQLRHMHTLHNVSALVAVKQKSSKS